MGSAEWTPDAKRAFKGILDVILRGHVQVASTALTRDQVGKVAEGWCAFCDVPLLRMEDVVKDWNLKPGELESIREAWYGRDNEPVFVDCPCCMAQYAIEKHTETPEFEIDFDTTQDGYAVCEHLLAKVPEAVLKALAR